MSKLTGDAWRNYWRDRVAKQGAKAVGHASMNEAKVDEQGEAFWKVLAPVLWEMRPSRIVEVGCGWGRMTERIAALFESDDAVEVHGIDMIAANVERANARNGRLATYHVGEKIPPEVGTFDAVVTCTCLQHVTDPTAWRELVGSIHRAVRPGGAVVMLENVSSPGARHMSGRGWLDYAIELRGFSFGRPSTHSFSGESHALMVGDRMGDVRIAVTTMNRPYTIDTLRQLAVQLRRSPIEYQVGLFDGEGDAGYLQPALGFLPNSFVDCDEDKPRNVIRNGGAAAAWLAGGRGWGLYLQDDLKLAPGFLRATELLGRKVTRDLGVVSYWRPYKGKGPGPLRFVHMDWRYFYGTLAVQATTGAWAEVASAAEASRSRKGFDLLVKRGFQRVSERANFVHPSLVRHVGMKSSVQPGRRHDHHVAHDFELMTDADVEREWRARA